MNTPAELPPQKIIYLRSLIGLIQGAVLYWLFHVAELKAWPFTSITLFSVLTMLALFMPSIMVLCLNHVKQRSLLSIFLILSVLIAGLTYYAVWRSPLYAWNGDDITVFPLLASCFTLVFILLALLLSGNHDHRWRAYYSTYFDFSWKLAIQFSLSCFFALAFWLILFLGAELLELIQLSFLRQLLTKSWFAIPFTSLAFTGGIHITDVRLTMVKSVRTLLLILLSWLLPPAAILVAIFVIGLILNGFNLLLVTHATTTILLFPAILLILLINCVYQDGQNEWRHSAIINFTTKLAAWLLIPLVGLSGYALSLRIIQWGWTVSRIYMTALIFVCICYAIAYARATFSRKSWMQFIESTNFYAALLIVTLLILLNSPVGDPARWSVKNQIARWRVGYTTQTALIQYLYNNGERFGRDALRILHAQAIGKKDQELRLAIENLQQTGTSKVNVSLTALQRLANITLHSANQKLPLSFIQQKWPNDWTVPRCLNELNKKCDAWLATDHDQTAVLLLATDDNQLIEFLPTQNQIWQAKGYWALPYNCAPVKALLKNNQFQLAEPLPATDLDLQIAGQRLNFYPRDVKQFTCAVEKNEQPQKN